MSKWELSNISTNIDDNNQQDKYIEDTYRLIHENKQLSSDQVVKELVNKEINLNIDDRQYKLSNNKYDYYQQIKKDNQILDKNYKINNSKPKKTILNMNISEIFDKTSNVFNNFSKEYKFELLKLYNENKETNSDKEQSFFSIIKMHILAFINYLKTYNTIVYLGILIVFISIIIYIFNITIR